MVPVYYYPGHPSNAFLLGDLKFYVEYQKFAYETFEHCDFVNPQVSSWISPYQAQLVFEYLQIEMVKLNPKRNRNIVVPNFCAPSKNIYLSLFMSALFMYILPG